MRTYIPLCVAVCAERAAAANNTKYVNLFLGTTNGGNMFPGVVAAPYAMVKLGPDVENGKTDSYSGYQPVGQVWGFSMMHESGTGGAPKYGVVSQMPANGCVANPLADLGQNRTANDTAEVGYYKSALANGATVELSATEHAGFYQYTFPQGNNSIIVDVSHVLPSFRGLGWGQGYAGGSFQLEDNGSYTGSGTYNNGWNLSPNWTIYFCGYFDQAPTSTRTFTGNGSTLLSYNTTSSTNGTYRQGGVFGFDQHLVTSRVGVSFISTAKACQSVDSEMPSGTQLQTLVEKAQLRWSEQVFGKVTTTETNTTVLTQLYSYLYGMHLLPSNRTGENPLWVSSEPSFDDFFTLWDLFRCSTPLWHVLQPTAYEEIIRSLIDIWRHEGWLPDARSSNFNGKTQGGSNADTVLADAYVKGVRGAVNWTAGYAAMKQDADITPPNNFDPVAPDSSTAQGRGALPDWSTLGYISSNFSRAVSRAVEYAVNDFGLTQVAQGLGLSDDYAHYLNRSRNWRNHWNAEQTSLGFKGFMLPKERNGSFQYPYDPLQCSGCYWGNPYYEDLPWSYSFNAQHDISHLISLCGGPAEFVQRLEKFFEPGIYKTNNAYGGTIFNPGNEPAFNTPYLFNFAGRQDLSVKYSRNAAIAYYNAGTGGIPGNSDAGAMQTWILWNMIGLYPLTGQTTFLIGSPFFEHLSIDLGSNKTLTITSSGGNRYTAPYVQSLKINGTAWRKAWVAWDDVFAYGAQLDFVLGANQTQWATGPLPPSPAS